MSGSDILKYQKLPFIADMAFYSRYGTADSRCWYRRNLPDGAAPTREYSVFPTHSPSMWSDEAGDTAQDPFVSDHGLPGDLSNDFGS